MLWLELKTWHGGREERSIEERKGEDTRGEEKRGEEHRGEERFAADFHKKQVCLSGGGRGRSVCVCVCVFVCVCVCVCLPHYQHQSRPVSLSSAFICLWRPWPSRRHNLIFINAIIISPDQSSYFLCETSQMNSSFISVIL